MKIFVRLLIFLIIAITMAGCSGNQKTDEQLKEEVIAELEAGKKEALDVRDKDGVYEFIKNTYPDVYTREDFDIWDRVYIDITKDGSDEVAFTAPYAEGNLDQVIFITGDGGAYKIIPSNIEFEKYENKIELKEDFITITQTGGGSGIHVTKMGIYVYDGKEIVFTGADILIEDVVAMPDGYAITGEMKGSMTDFVHIVTKEDFATEKISIEEESRYVYDNKSMKFKVEDITNSKQDYSNEKNLNQIQLSVKMTQEDILDMFGYEYETEEANNVMDDSTITTIKYPGIEFEFSHYSDEPPLDALPIRIVIKSDKYRYNYDVHIGDSALEAIKRCEKTFENFPNMHGAENEKLPDWFIYKEANDSGQMVENGYILAFEYNTGERYLNKKDITEDVLVKSIMLLGEYN